MAVLKKFAWDISHSGSRGTSNTRRSMK